MAGKEPRILKRYLHPPFGYQAVATTAPKKLEFPLELSGGRKKLMSVLARGETCHHGKISLGSDKRQCVLQDQRRDTD